MSMTVSRRKDTKTPRVFMHKTADIRGGVSVNVTELGSDFLQEGAVLSAPKDGICHVVKVAQVTAQVAESDKTITVKKGGQFKVGDFILTKLGNKASKITAIDNSGKDNDKITIDAALGAIAIGDFIVEAKAASTTTTSELKYAPFSLTGTGKPIDPKSNLNVDAWVIGVTQGNPLPDFISEKLKGIINY